MSTIKGSCLCERVSFECEDDFQSFHLCHCKQCQKITGSAHASNLFTRVDNIKWLKGEALLKRYNMPERFFSKNFCTECGSAMPYVTQSGKALIVPAGCLDQGPSIAPQDNIYCSEKASWYASAIEAPSFDKFP